MEPRTLVRRLAIAAPLAGIALAVSLQVQAQVQMREAERVAAATLEAIVEAQRAFRRAGGGGGYATDLASLTAPCPGGTVAALPPPLATAGHDYAVEVRASRRAAPMGVDCHGRATASDFHAAARPLHPWAGRQAMAVTSWGRIHVLFDGLPPGDRDMETAGLAVPLDTLDTFKIP